MRSAFRSTAPPLLTDVTPYDADAGDNAQTLWIGQLFGSPDSKGNMYLDNIVVIDGTPITAVTTEAAITLTFETETGKDYTVRSADDLNGFYTDRKTFGGTGKEQSWGEGVIGAGKRFYEVKVEYAE